MVEGSSIADGVVCSMVGSPDIADGTNLDVVGFGTNLDVAGVGTHLDVEGGVGVCNVGASLSKDQIAFIKNHCGIELSNDQIKFINH